MLFARAGLVSARPIPAALLDRIPALLLRPLTLTVPDQEFHAVMITGRIEENCGPQVHRRLRALAEDQDVDASLVWGDLAERGPGLIVMDVDSTFITAEVIELIAAHAGSAELVAEITERAMRGELDFAASLAERVATLAGLPEQALTEVAAEIRLSPGAAELVQAAQAQGIGVALVSGGFHEIVDPLAARLGIELVRANRFEIADGKLTGRTLGPVVDRAAKRRHLIEFAESLGIGTDRVVAIGDGANDLDMLAEAGLGVAYCAKPITRAAADAAISFPRLDAVRAFTGLYQI